MNIDRLAFFHEATLKICGSLDIHEVFQQCFQFLKSYLPISSIDCNLFDPDSGGVDIIAWASDHGSKPPLNQPTFVSEAARAELKDSIGKGVVTDFAGEMAISKELARALGIAQVSALGLSLPLKGNRLAGVGVLSHKTNVFTQDHVRLLEMLRDPFTIAISNHLRYQEVLKLQALLEDDNRYLQNELHRISGNEIVGEHFGLKHVMEMVRQVASLDNHVLLLGETGVGKEVLANTVHNLSPRRNGPFIKVNCGAISETLLDSELFGHEKGAFTGAGERKRGRFERAHRGTIFLDEVGELQPQVQVRLLRVLQEKTIERVGGTSPVVLDLRVIAATHRNLQTLVKSGRFREDLWYRLNVFPITIPPLRQRKVDIPAFIEYFLERKVRELNLQHHPVLAADAIARLQAYDWPGNVRELENVVERALIRSQAHPSKAPLRFDHIDPALEAGTGSAADSPAADGPDVLNLGEVNRRHIVRVLQMTSGKVQGKTGAADLLGLNPGTLRSRMRKLGVPFGRKRK